ncbi:TPA: CRISPR-associated endonuclease Cas2 [Stenotrophomonas maltophilia]|nr:CRISPR-associated endonuclease Cas2 [Stenotrophomonas maltophilia]
MAKFLVAYDLRDGQDYARIINELDRLGAVRTQKSTYLVSVTTDVATGFLQHLRGFVDEDDLLMVVKLHERPRYTRAMRGTNDWVDRNFPA